MSAMGVHTSLARYRDATAELPSSARGAESPEGSIVVVDGARGWWTRAVDAFTAGAVGAVIARPASAPAEALAALAATGRAVVVERGLLRPDVAGYVAETLAGLPDASVVTVECHAPAPAHAALHDAIGWARVLARGPLEVRAASFARGRGLALLETADGLPVSLVSATQDDAPVAGRIRVTALAETLVELDGASGNLSPALTDAGSRRTAPARFERAERLALRRAIDAVVGHARPTDLAELQHDQARAADLVDSSRS
jgi:hypothetical protein